MRVLNLEWGSHIYRDRIPASLISNYLRLHGHEVLEGPVFSGYKTIRKFKPDLIFKAGYLGSVHNFKLIKYARSLNIPLVILTAEGNLPDEFWTNEGIFWGWNTDRKLLEDRLVLWTERTRNLAKGNLSDEDQKKISVGGGAFFDHYKLATLLSKDQFLKKHKCERFKRVVGFGCWDFGLIQPEDSRYEATKLQFGEKYLDLFNLDHEKLNSILIEVVKENPDTLFIFKKHPGEQATTNNPSATKGVENYPNAIVLKNEWPIGDVIQVCDLWLVYESTTLIEAWLLDKPTALVNPTTTEFPRSLQYRGAPNFDSAEKITEVISKIGLPELDDFFTETQTARQNCIKDTLQWADGLNHVRTGNIILDELEKAKSTKIHSGFSIKEFKEKVKFDFLAYIPFGKRFKTYKNQKQLFSKEEVEIVSSEFMKAQKKFYKKLNMKPNDLRKIPYA